MSRPRVLCVSADRNTRASVTLSLTDAPVNVVIAQESAAALERLDAEPIDAVVVDATTIPNVPAVTDAVESRAPECPTFVYWGERGGDESVLTEVVAGADGGGPSPQFGAAIVDRLGADDDGSAANPSRSADVDALEVGDDVDVPEELETALATARCRLVDARSPVVVERVLREECTALERFEFAWVGEFDRGEREVVPWLTDLEATTWPLRRTFSIGGGDQPLLERALETRELQHVEDVERNADLVPLGDRALERGVRSVAVAPLASVDQLYGVLVVYARRPLSAGGRETIRSLTEAASAVLETIDVRGRLEQHERALHRYERLVETAGDGMYVLDDQGHFTTINDALNR